MGVTSEPQYLADEAEQDWELNFKVVGDPHQEIRHALKEKNWLDVYSNDNWQHFGNDRDWTRHPNGYYQKMRNILEIPSPSLLMESLSLVQYLQHEDLHKY